MRNPFYKKASIYKWMLFVLILCQANLGSKSIPPQRTLVIGSNVELDFKGQLIRLPDNSNSPVIVIGDTETPPKVKVTNVVIKNLIIDGNMDRQKFEGWGGEVDTGGEAYIRNSGIVIRFAENVRLENVQVTNCRSGGIVIEKHSKHIVIVNSECTKNFFDGVACYETTGSLFKNVNMNHNNAAGFSGDLKVENVVFENCQFSMNKAHGIFLRDSKSNIFKDSFVFNNGHSGLFIAQNDHLVETAATDNKVINTSFAGNGTDVIINDESCVGNSVDFVPGLTTYSKSPDALIINLE